MQLFNIALGGLFFGLLCAHLAKRQGKQQLPWFLIGFGFALFGLIFFLIRSRVQRRPRVKAPPRSIEAERSEAWVKMWYYLEPQTRDQKGPMEFPDLAKNWRSKALSDKTLIWGEGMDEWKKLSDLPDVVKEMEKV